MGAYEIKGSSLHDVRKILQMNKKGAGRPLQTDWEKLLNVEDGVFLPYGKGDRNSMVTACRKWMQRRGYKVLVKSIVDPKNNVMIAIFTK